jgi:rod shape-determining protein MreC
MLNRQYYMALGLVVLIVAVVLNLPDRKATRLKLVIGGLFLPLFGLAGSAQHLSEQIDTSLTPRSQLLSELERLRQENQQLHLQLMQAQEAWRENTQLRQSVGWRGRAPWQLKLARVIGQDPADWWRSILIDAGSRDGVRTNMAVLTAEGLVGRVSEVGFDRSRVLMVGDPNCRIATQVLQPGDKNVLAKGIIAPGSSSLDRLLVDLTYVPGGSLLKPGQSVVTSGDGGVFPKGISVGQIVDVRTNDFGLYLEARVKLAVNLNHLESVFVVQ